MCTDDPSISSQVDSASQANTNSTYQEESEAEDSDFDEVLYTRGYDGGTSVWTLSAQLTHFSTYKISTVCEILIRTVLFIFRF